MKVPIVVTINPKGKADVYHSLDRAEDFIRRLLASEAATELAAECQVELPTYAVSAAPKLYRALGLSHAPKETHSYSAWELEHESGRARNVKEFEVLAGENGAAEFNGRVAREWKQSGGESTEDIAGIHLLSRNGKIVKKLWIEANRRS